MLMGESDPVGGAANPDLLRIGDVMRITRLSRSTVYSLMRDGTFPKPRKLTSRLRAWDAADVRAWSRQRPRVGDSQ